MTPEDRPKFLEIVIGFAELKGRELSAPALELYWNALQDWDIEDFQQAANHLIRTCQFMPTPRDFEELRKAGRPTAGEAWLQIRQMARSSLTAEPDDPVAARALRAIGGLRAVGMCDYSKIEFMERRFAEHYESMRESEDTREALPQIACDSVDRDLLAVLLPDHSRTC